MTFKNFKIFGILLVTFLLAGCSGGIECIRGDGKRSVVLSSDWVFQTIDIGASPTHSIRASWVESIQVYENGSFDLIIRQDYIDTDGIRKTSRIQKIYDSVQEIYTSEVLGSKNKIWTFSCGRNVSGFEFFLRIIQTI